MANTYFCWVIYAIIIVAYVQESRVYFLAYVSTFIIMEMVYNVIYYYYFQNCYNTECSINHRSHRSCWQRSHILSSFLCLDILSAV